MAGLLPHRLLDQAPQPLLRAVERREAGRIQEDGVADQRIMAHRHRSVGWLGAPLDGRAVRSQHVQNRLDRPGVAGRVILPVADVWPARLSLLERQPRVGVGYWVMGDG